MYLIDTSVWIDFLRGHKHPKVAVLETLLEEGEAYLCEITYSEVCFGAKDERQFQRYEQHFSEMPFLSLPLAWHKKVARMGFILRKAGFVPHSADLLIALVALEHSAVLLTKDRNFHPFKDLFGLQLE